MKTNIKKHIFLLFFIVFTSSVFCQTDEIDELDMDELMNVITNKPSLPIDFDTLKVKDNNLIRIGFLLPMSKYKEFSQDLLRAAQLAADEINANGKVLGKEIVIIPADDAGDADISAYKAAELINKYKVAAILGPTGSSRVIHVAKKATISKNTLLLAIDVYSEQITDLKDNNLVWRTAISDVLQAKVAAEFAINNLKKKDVAILFVKNAYGKGLNQEFKKEFMAIGGNIVTEVGYSDLIDFNTYDFKPKLDTLFANKPSLIYFITNPIEGALLTHKIDSLKYFTNGYNPIILSGSANNADFLKNANKNIAEGMYGTSIGYADIAQFDDNFKAKYNVFPTNNAVSGAYDFVYLVAYSILQGKDIKPNVIKNNLFSVSQKGEVININEYAKAKNLIEKGIDIDYNGASGKIEFNDKGDVTDGRIKIWRIKNGIFETIQNVDLKK